MARGKKPADRRMGGSADSKAARTPSAHPPTRPSALRVVGKALRKVDATAKVLGVTKFADDLSLPRMLYSKLLRSPHPHARIVRVDAAQALALPGVKPCSQGRISRSRSGSCP